MLNLPRLTTPTLTHTTLPTVCLTCPASLPRPASLPHPPCSCGSAITKLERIPSEVGLFISPLTLQGFRSEADLAKHAQELGARLQAMAAAAAAGAGGGPGMAAMGMGMGGMAGMPGGGMPAMYMQKQQQQPGWKPPPPPGAPPGGAGYGRGGGGGQQQQPRTGQGAVMRPR